MVDRGGARHSARFSDVSIFAGLAACCGRGTARAPRNARDSMLVVLVTRFGLKTLLRLAESRSGGFLSLRKASLGFFRPFLACFGTYSARMQTPRPFFKKH